jgi:ribosomal protein L37AE/L43A
MEKKMKVKNNLSNKQNDKPICNICKKLIENVWVEFEKFSYKTMSGEIKEVWCCIDCQLNNLSKEEG